MRKKARALLLFLLLLLTLSLIPMGSAARGDLDVIHSYEIDVVPRNDGTLDMTYRINWEVLDDDSEGPLEWVEIGTWNRKVRDVENLSEGVAMEVEATSNDGSYIRVDFWKEYYKGDVVDFSYRINQTYAFTIGEDGTVQYRFNPGWFDEILVEDCIVRWKADGVMYSNSERTEDGWLVWEHPLDYGETIDVDATYDKSFFSSINEEENYDAFKRRERRILFIIVSCATVFIASILILIVIAVREAGDGYCYYCGFSGPHYHSYYWFRRPHHTPGYTGRGKRASSTPISVANASRGGAGRSTGGGSCACACACACAGGGRAGCSRKDFTKEEQLRKEMPSEE